MSDIETDSSDEEYPDRTVTGSIKHVFNEGLLLGQLTVDLIFEMGSRFVWLWMTIRMLIYVILLAPALWRAMFIFCVSDFIEKGVKYGPNPRNYLDIYHPSKDSEANRKKTKKRDRLFKLFRARHVHKQRHTRVKLKGGDSSSTETKKYPVVIFITGGAWIIGYKAWGAFMGMLMARLGVLFISVDYRNFPQGTISDMKTDVNTAVEWVFNNIHKYGGDASRIFLVTQSAGAQISTMVVLENAYYSKLHKMLKQKKQKQKEEQSSTVNNGDDESSTLQLGSSPQKSKYSKPRSKPKWVPRDLAGFVGISGAYDLYELQDHINARGLYTNVFLHIMENDLKRYSPFYFLTRFKPTQQSAKHPRAPKFIRALSDMSTRNIYPLSDTGNDTTSDSSELSSPMNRSETLIPAVFDRRSGAKILRRQRQLYKTRHRLDPIKVPIEMCPVFLFHGTADQSTPHVGTTTLAKYLEKLQVETYVKLYQNKSHTSPIIEDPIEGKDPLMCDLLRVVFPNEKMDAIVMELERLMQGSIKMPLCILQMARIICPF